MHEHFRVTVCPEAVARGLEFPSQTVVVVYFPVEYDSNRSIFVANGLLTSTDIDDAESANAESQAICYVITVRVRAAMHYGIAHRPHTHGRLVVGYLDPHKARYATHTLC